MIAGLSDAGMGLLECYCLTHCPFSIAVAAAIALELMAVELPPFITIKSSLAVDSLDKVVAPGSY